MCGIVGTWGIADRAIVGRMNRLIQHRGPDGEGEHWDDHAMVGLAMRRLAILDPAGGAQPMASDDGQVWIVFNGEIFNAPALREGMLAEGHRFRSSNSDTEVLLRLYESDGPSLLSRVDGMFAFVVHDKRRRVLFGARDRLGIKPLYYSHRPREFAFASELKCLLVSPHVTRELDSCALYHYMSLLFVPGDQSILAGVKRLPAGHSFSLDLQDGSLSIDQYWRLQTRTRVLCPDPVGVVGLAVRDAVKRWTLSDVPVGCALSGGLDSSALVGVLSEKGGVDVQTYSVGFGGDGEERWNELPRARLVAQRWGTRHHELVVDADALLSDLVTMVWHLDEPYGGGLPSWFVFRFMAQSVKVAMTGSGGDELFGNYGKFVTFERSPFARFALAHPQGYQASSRRLRWIWQPLVRLVSDLPAGWLGYQRRKRMLALLDMAGTPIGRYYFNAWYYFSDTVKRHAVLQTSPAEASTEALLEAWSRGCGSSSIRDRLAYVDINTQLADEFLLMTDRLSMAHGLEARVPFLDHHLVETVFSLTAEQRTSAEEPKRLLRQAFQALYPAEVAAAPKQGFVLPIGLWLRGPLKPLAMRLLSPQRLAAQGLFNPGFFLRYVAPHLAGRADFTWQVWAALMFQLWHVVFIESRSTEPPSFTWRDLV